MSNLCEEVLIIHNGNFFPKKVSKKNVRINLFVKTATFLERQLTLTKLQIVGYSFDIVVVFRTIFFEKKRDQMCQKSIVSANLVSITFKDPSYFS